MSAVPQLHPREKQIVPPPDPEMENGAPAVSENPLQLLRDALDRLKSANGDLPDQAQVAGLLAEARDALERTSIVSRAVAQCDGFLKEAQFEQAFEALDAALAFYPGDPALTARRRDGEQQQRAFQAAVAVRSALEEARWLLEQDRVDLAVQFLQGKTAEWPDQPELIARLEQLEDLLPQWEEKRHVQATLARAAELEHLQQGQAALTVIEEALQTYPRSTELMSAARRVRDRLAGQERRRKLARRVESVEQKIASQAWREALALLDETRKEFADAEELEPLQHAVEDGLRRSQCDAVAARVRECLADGELEHADEMLRAGIQSLGPESAFEALCAELVAARKYRDALHQAQVLFGRRQLAEAENVLAEIAAPEHPETQALLEAVRRARAASEEQDFCERGRRKALDLIEQKQYAQAIDLLRNLLNLFPGNLILERDLLSARAKLAQAQPEPAAPAAQEPVAAPLPAAAPAAARPSGAASKGSASRLQRVAVAGAASLVLASGAVWKLTRKPAPEANPTAQAERPAATAAESAPPAPTAATPVSGAPAVSRAPEKSALPASSTTAAKPKPQPPAQLDVPAPSLRPFIPAPLPKSTIQSQNVPLPPAPATGAIISATMTTTMPGVAGPVMNAPARPAPPPPATPPPTAAAKPALPTGGRFEPPEILERTTPEYPALARNMRMFGQVRLEALIDEKGGVTSVKILSGQPLLAGSAKNAVQRWKFRAGRLDGTPIPSSMEVQITFSDGNQ